ncbi:MAG: S41 family peptidase, partial [Alistipes sp.]|nr:S41 family peptidase [Alistipes sp.]
MRVVSKIVLLVSLLLFVAIDGAYAQNPNSKPKLAPNVEQLQKIMRVYNNLDKLYVEDVDMKPLVEKAIRSMLLELDPHSTYLTAEEMKSAMEMTRGKFGGIGVAYDVYHDSIVVTNVLPGGPAENVGVRPNDRIVEVDSKSVVDIQRGDVPKLLRGDIGSVVDIGVVRHGVAEMLNFSIKRDNIPLTSVDAAYRVDESVGYIKVNRFGNTTMSEFREAMVKLQGIETLILDLSSNPGGLLNQAIDMADYFLPKGLLVTSTEGRAIPTTEYLSKNNQEFDGRVIVIINEGSASGSEAVAGALQDWDRALIVGRRSYGKG